MLAVGDNSYGQCGVTDWTGIVAICTGVAETVGLKADGTVVAADDYGDLGRDLSGWTSVAAISAGLRYLDRPKADGSRGCGWAGMIMVNATFPTG